MHDLMSVAPAANDAERPHHPYFPKSSDLESRRLAAQLARLQRISAQAEQQSRQI